MEKITQYFIQEINAASNPLIKLSVITALLKSFLEQPPSCKVAASTSNLVKCLLEILNEEFGVNAGLEPETETGDQYKTEMSSLKHSNWKGSSSSSSPNGKSESEAVSTVRDLLKLMTLKSIYKFSTIADNVNQLNEEVKKSIITFYTNACDMEKVRHDTRYFQYSLNFTRCVQKYIAASDWIIKVKVVKDENEKLRDMAVLKRHLEFYGERDAADCIMQINEGSQFELIGISVVTDSSNSDGGMVDLLQSQQVAWGRVSKYHSATVNLGLEKAGKKSKSNHRTSKSDNVCDLMVRKVMHGNLLWVNVGKDSMEEVEKIHSVLERERESGSLRGCKLCHQNDTVSTLVPHNEVFVSCDGGHLQMMMIRARILSVVAGIATVFGIDVGGVFKVPLASVFNLPTELNISTIPQQVALAFLYDVSPTPVQFSHVELMLATMCNFCRLRDVSIMFMDLNLLPILPALVLCRDSIIASQAARVATYVAKNVQVNRSHDWCHILTAALECLNNLVKKYMASEQGAVPRSNSSLKLTTIPKADDDAVGSDTKSKSPSKHSLSDGGKDTRLPKSRPVKGTASDMPKSLEDGNRAKEEDDLPDTERDKSKEKDDRILIVSILTLLTNLIHRNQPMKEALYHQNGLESIMLCHKIPGQKRGLSSSITKLLFVFWDGGMGHRNHSIRPVLTMDDKIEADEDSTGSDEDEDIESNLDSLSEEDEWEERDSFHKDRSCPGSEVAENDSMSLVKGSIYPHVTNPSYELLDGLDWTSDSLASIVCGMLNSGQGGTICVGVGKRGEVVGEAVTHTMRDGLRLGMDNLMVCLVPNVMHFQLQVRFVPVVAGPGNTKQTDGEDDSLNSLHVIEIEWYPIRGVIHTLKNARAYYRTGSNTILVNEQDIRHLIVIDEEQKFMDEILDLQRKLQSLTSV